MKEASAHIDYGLLAKYLAGECTDDETIRVESWIAASEGNKAEFETTKSIWEFSKASPLDIDIDEAWKTVDASTNAEVIPLFKRLPSYYSIAASIAILIAVSAGIWFYNQSGMESMQTYGNLAQVTLDDASLVDLSEHSSIRYASEFSDEYREVWLSGIAYFQVSPDASRPFIVHTSQGDVTVVGTAFEIDTRTVKGQMTVEVAEGIVEVSAAETERMERVTAGQTAVVAEAKSIELENKLTPGAFFWKDKTIKFKRTQLREVVQTLNDLLWANISIESDAIKECELTATFKDEPLATILEVISATLGISVDQQGGKYILTGEGC